MNLPQPLGTNSIRGLARCVTAVCGVWLIVAGCQPGDVPAGRGVTGVPAPPSAMPMEPVAAKSTTPTAKPNGISAGLSNLPVRKPAAAPREVAPLRFHDAALESGVQFTYDNGSAAHRQLMVEGTGGGVAWLDYDRDGHWDLYFVQSGDPVTVDAKSPSDKLFRNLSGGRFADSSAPALISETRYGQGVSIGDFDGDGFDDIFVTNVGDNVLFHNLGDGTFENVTQSLAGSTSGWSTSAAWADLDLDGDLDLYVCRYCQFDPLQPPPCLSPRGVPTMCQPKRVQSVPDLYYVNQGDGRFLEQARERGLFGTEDRGLGVAIADFNDDDWPDVYVGNDATPNFLFLNDGHGRFRESALQLGCSVTLSGQAQGSMGVAVADYDRNGHLDLYVSNFEGEGDSLYQNQGTHGFQEVSGIVGLVAPTTPMVGWGVILADFNQDGQDELFVANGHIDDGRHVGGDLEQQAQLFSFDGERFLDVTDRGGSFFQRKHLGRGVASCDYDNDGDLDLAFIAQNAPASLLRNESPRGHWLKLGFIGSSGNRRGIGTRVTLRVGHKTLVQELAGGTSYCASHQPILLFGLGDSTGPCELEIRWPGGARQKVPNVHVDQSLMLRESESQVTAQP